MSKTYALMFFCQMPKKRATLADCSPVLLSHKDSNLKLQNQNLTCCQLHHGTNFKCFLSKDGAKLQSYFDMSQREGQFFDGVMGKVGEIWRREMTGRRSPPVYRGRAPSRLLLSLSLLNYFPSYFFIGVR